MKPRHGTLTGTLIAGALLVSACAGTRTTHLGTLPNSEPLLTLVVSQDFNVIQSECSGVQAPGRILGCHKGRNLTLSNGRPVKVMKVARYAETLPSDSAFAGAALQLCRAIAALQPIDDPCGAKSGAVQQSRVTP